MTVAIPAILPDDIDLIEGEHSRLATLIRMGPTNIDRWLEMYGAAEKHCIEKLTEAGAVIATRGERTMIHFHGLKVRSQFRLHGALRAWANAAREQLAEQGKTQ